ncbi:MULTISPECIES: polyprenyl synthetase family protein [Bacillus]|uniref:Quorum-sensing protein n=1 Tax=Bacillus pumilus TaxID=1408 RepID=A0AAE4B9T3_BACPU|nr:MULTISPECIES: polyprenyl synthetase family protein [Bacillus]MCY7618504.1 polyprenyl synthetase family protein [Bacillus pumilus]MDF9458262.1 polyprenyl synthetase family protein [Bacillus pumilus]MDR4250464.1 quorum-sensing protein [Bacillus pumilus]PAC81319.1 quorum-sensing protein [Bacillus sp. 7788]PRS41685.1 quorum-sensing protein [Bacillus sp. NMCC4]
MLNYLENTKIKQNMSDFIQHAVRQKDLQQLLLEFTDRKNEFPFGQLAYKHYEAFGGQDKQAITQLSAGIELLILSADILDDIEDQDNDSYPWMNVDQGVAINASTYLYTLSTQFIISIGENDSQLIEKLFQLIKWSMEGQHEDLRHMHETEEECVEVLRKKSGSLTALSSVLGVYLATRKINSTVESYSICYGVAEQISNDFFALFSKTNGDFLKKQTLAFSYLQRGFNDASQELLTFFSGRLDESEQKSFQLKQKLLEAGLTQYMVSMREIMLLKMRQGIEQLDLPKTNKEQLYAFMTKEGND